MKNFLKDKIILRNILVLILFVAIVFILYFPTLNSLPLWDDWVFLFKSWTLQNAPIYKYWFWSENRRSWPLFYTAISSMYKFWGLNFFNYHLVNLVLHACNGFLLYKLLKKMNGSHCLLVSLLYVVHPLQFYIVVWIIQIKTLMAIFFFLASFYLFIDSEKHGSKIKYILSILTFALSLFSKSVFAPVVLLLIFYKSKAKVFPYVILCIYSILLTMWTSHIKELVQTASNPSFITSTAYSQNDSRFSSDLPIEDNSKKEKLLSVSSELNIAANNLSKYTGFMIYPWKTLLVHPSTQFDDGYKQILYSFLVILLIIWMMISFWEKKDFISLGGISFYLITLIPLCGLFFIPIFHYSNFVEYWLSAPFLGIILCLSFCRYKKMPYLLSIFIFLFAIKTFIVVRKNPEPVSMINASIEANPENSLVKLILASHYEFNHEFPKANKILLNIQNSEGINFLDKQKFNTRINDNIKKMRGEKNDDYTN